MLWVMAQHLSWVHGAAVVLHLGFPTRGDVALGHLAISGVIFSCSNLLCELLLASSVYRPSMLLLRILQCETGPVLIVLRL